MSTQTDPAAGGRMLYLGPKLAQRQAARVAQLGQAQALFDLLGDAQRAALLERLLYRVMARPSSAGRVTV